MHAASLLARPTQAGKAELAELVDPDGVNPQRVVDVFDDLASAVKSETSRARNLIAKTKKLLDKKISLIVDTQTAKSGSHWPAGRQGPHRISGPARSGG